MMKEKNPYLTEERRVFLHTFKRQPLLITRASGSTVWDDRGRRYLDFFSGLAVCGVGHNNRQVVGAIRRQAGQLLHASNYFYTRPQNAAARALTARLPGSRVFFSNSGAEANELAIKLARLWAHQNGKKGRDILTFENAFHGRTLATSAASQGQRRPHRYFDPMPTGFHAVPFNDLQATRNAISIKTIAIMLEPVQGEGGIHIATPAFFRGIQEICRAKKILLIVDEVQSGMARTGRFFAHLHYRVKPDIVTLAKGLAGGMPLGATLAAPHVARWVTPGLHGSTFGGNPVACAAAVEVLRLLSPAALKRIQNGGRYLRGRLETLRRYPCVVDIRNLGLMAAVELNQDGAALVSCAREKGLLINCTQGHILRFLPPYFITRAEIDRAVSTLHAVFAKIPHPALR